MLIVLSKLSANPLQTEACPAILPCNNLIDELAEHSPQSQLPKCNELGNVLDTPQRTVASHRHCKNRIDRLMKSHKVSSSSGDARIIPSS